MVSSEPSTVAFATAPQLKVSQDPYSSSISRYDDEDEFVNVDTQKQPEVEVGWKSPSLTRMGQYHPIEPAHVFLNRELLPAVLDRLPVIFQQLSLRVQYEATPVAAVCETLEQVCFCVSLLERRNNHQEMVLEVQRMAGDSIVFAHYAKQIMKSIQTQEVATPRPQSLAVPTLEKAESLLRHSIADVEEEDPAESALEVAHTLILCDRYDARRLGLESLVFLTDPTKTGLDVCVRASQAVLLATLYPEIQKRVIGLALKGCWPNESQLDEQDSYLALMVLAHATSHLQTAEQMMQFLEACRGLTGVDLIHVLLTQIHQAATHPHTAYYAVQTLISVCKVLPQVLPPKAVAVLEQAKRVGVSSHAALESVSGQLLVALQA